MQRRVSGGEGEVAAGQVEVERAERCGASAAGDRAEALPLPRVAVQVLGLVAPWSSGRVRLEALQLRCDALGPEILGRRLEVVSPQEALRWAGSGGRTLGL